MNVSFIRCTTIGAFTNAVNNSVLTEGGIYFITVKSDPLILSVAIATGKNTYELIMGNVVATKPTIGADGQTLTYFDAGGNAQNIDLSLYTIGDKNQKGLPFPSVGISGFYMGTLGESGEVAQLPTAFVTTGDYYKCVTAGTYGGVSLSVGDFIRATSSNPIVWAKAIPESMSGMLMNGDSIQNAFRKLQTNIDDSLADFVDRDTFTSKISDLESRISSIIKLKGEVANQEELMQQIGCVVGTAFRVTQAASFELMDSSQEVVTFSCEPGDLLVVVKDNLPPGENYPDPLHPANEAAWTVLQNNLDLTAVLGNLDANADEGKILTLLRYQDGAVEPTYSQLTSVRLIGYTEREDNTLITIDDLLGEALRKLEDGVLEAKDLLTWKSL
jgi:hypothetical protein